MRRNRNEREVLDVKKGPVLALISVVFVLLFYMNVRTYVRRAEQSPEDCFIRATIYTYIQKNFDKTYSHRYLLSMWVVFRIVVEWRE